MALNMDQINQLKSIESSSGQEGLVANIVNMFLDSIEAEKDKLATLLADGKYDEASKLAHSMKSSSRNLGADELAEILQHIEDIGAGRGDVEKFDRQQTLTGLETKLSEVIGELQQFAA